MNISRRHLIRYAYTLSQFLTVAAQFAGSTSTLFEYGHSKDLKDEDYRSAEYGTMVASGLIAGTVAGLTAFKFQGVKIVNGEEPDHAHSPTLSAVRNQNSRTWQSNFWEAAYLLSATTLLTINNYFTMAGFKAFINALQYPESTKIFTPLSAVGFSLLALKTLVIDLPFEGSNAMFECAEQIKLKLTGNADAPLVSKIMNPIAHKRLISVIAWLGTLSHASWDLSGIILFVPPEAYLALYNDSKPIFWLLISFLGGIVLPCLSTVNIVQTRYFEGKETEHNLMMVRKMRLGKSSLPLLSDLIAKDNTFLHRIFRKAPALKKPIRYGFYSQSLLHAFSDAMPLMLFLRHLLSSSSETMKLSVTVTVALFVLLGSAVGSYYSEVSTSIERFDEDFMQKKQNELELGDAENGYEVQTSPYGLIA